MRGKVRKNIQHDLEQLKACVESAP